MQPLRLAKVYIIPLGKNFTFTSCISRYSARPISFQKAHWPKINHQKQIYVNLSSTNIKAPTKKRAGEFSWKSFFISATIAGLLFAWFKYLETIKRGMREKEQSRRLGLAKIGGAFEMTDHHGKPCTEKDFLGKWVLIYFGFTHCPDICPEELEKLVEAVDILDNIKEMPPIVPLFVSVDPERDDADAVAAYIAEFSPKIIGLTGTPEQVDKMTKSFRVHYSIGPRDKDNDYIVDHSISTYLIDPDGKFVDYFGQTSKSRDIAEAVSMHVMKYNSKHKIGFWNKLVPSKPQAI